MFETVGILYWSKEGPSPWEGMCEGDNVEICWIVEEKWRIIIARLPPSLCPLPSFILLESRHQKYFQVALQRPVKGVAAPKPVSETCRTSQQDDRDKGTHGYHIHAPHATSATVQPPQGSSDGSSGGSSRRSGLPTQFSSSPASSSRH